MEDIEKYAKIIDDYTEYLKQSRKAIKDTNEGEPGANGERRTANGMPITLRHKSKDRSNVHKCT